VEGGGFTVGAVSFGADVCEEAVEAELDMKSWIT
jgi:hypothetical protein